MTKGNPLKLMLQFAFPLLIGNLLQQTYNIIDAAIVGQILGAKALASVGASSSIQFLVLGFCMGSCTGFGVPIAKYFGAGKLDQMRNYVFNGALLTAGIAVILTALCSVFCPQILHMLSVPEDIYDNAYAYLLIIFLGIPFTLLYNYLSSILRSLGDSRTPFLFLAFSAILNIFLDLFCIVVLKWGCAGAAAATITAQAISGILCLVFIGRKMNVLHLTKENRMVNITAVKELLAMGLPTGLQFSITAIGVIVVQGAINVYGENYMAGFSAAGKLQNIFSTVFVAFGATIATYVGQNRGAGKMDRVKQGVRCTQLMILVYSVFAMLILYFLGRYMARLFIDASETQVLGVAETYFHTVFWCYPFLGSIFLYRNALQGLGYGLVPMVGGIFELVARTGIIMLVAGHTSFAGVCLADPAAWISALIPLIPYYIYTMRKWEKQRKAQMTAN